MDASFSPWGGGGGGVTDCVHLQNRQHTEGLEEHCDVDRIHGLRG